MTLEELAEELNVGSNYLFKRFRDVQRFKEEVGIYITREGRGDSADYGIKNYFDTEMRFEHLDTEDFDEDGRILEMIKNGELTATEAKAYMALVNMLEGQEGKDMFINMNRLTKEIGVSRGTVYNMLNKMKLLNKLEVRSGGVKGTYVRLLED